MTVYISVTPITRMACAIVTDNYKVELEIRGAGSQSMSFEILLPVERTSHKSESESKNGSFLGILTSALFRGRVFLSTPLSPLEIVC